MNDSRFRAGSPLTDLLSELGEMSERPLAEALTLPPDAYRSAAFLDLEIEHIFRREWVCVGRADEIPHPGDYFTGTIIDEPLLIVRGHDGDVHALSNVCRHRWTPLKSDRGHAASFQCPYHAWTYDLSGQLIGAPFMDKSPGFDLRHCRLPGFRSEVWQGFIYVTLDDDAAPLAPRLEDLAKTLKHYHLGDMRTVVSEEEVWDCNWKALAENAMESYHLFKVHKDTLEPFFPTAQLEMRAGGAGYNLHRGPMREGVDYAGAADAAALNADLTPLEQRSLWLSCVYPSHVIAVSFGSAIWIAMQPFGVHQVKLRWGYAQSAGFPEPGTTEGAAYREGVRQGVGIINGEDRGIVTLLQRGVTASRAGRGRLSYLDWPIWEFGRYLARRIVGGLASLDPRVCRAKTAISSG